MKKILSLVLLLCMLVGVGIPSFAGTTTPNSHEQLTNEDVYALQKYISVTDSGLFSFNASQAQKDSVDAQLIALQKAHLAKINKLIRSNVLKAERNLEIDVVNETAAQQFLKSENKVMAASSGHWASCSGGINTNVEFHWWGYSRYACNCRSNQFSADLNSVASLGAGVAVVSAFMGNAPVTLVAGLDSTYWWLLASRVDANNQGKGTIIGVTYLLVFDIEPQR